MQKRNSRKRNKRIEATIGKIFMLVIAVFILLNLIVPDKELSETENRMLTQRPELTISSIASGDFMTKYEDYLADQFAGRELWRSLKVAVSRLAGNREENGVLLGKNGQLLEEIAEPDQDVLTENIEAIQAFTETYSDIDITMMIVPDAATVLTDSLPAFATVADQERMISQVKRELGESLNWIDAGTELKKHTDEKIYYKTDAHWTTLGAFYVFSAAAETLGIDSDAASGFASYPVSTTFNGTLASTSGYQLDTEEEIDIYVLRDGDNDVVVNYVDEQRKTTSLYDSSKLETRDQYGVFLGGNTSVIDVKTASESTDRLLVIKDSFANSFIPFLTPYYREIVVVDPRYYAGTIDEIMDTYRITDTLILYSGNTFFRDNNISGVLGGTEDGE